MKTTNLSACIVTEKVEQSKAFYLKNFDAKVIFDCGWYVNMAFGSKTATLQFMAPQHPEQLTYKGEGLMYNFEVDDVDAEYERLTRLGNTPVMPLEDHPWGDRGFAILDPNGIVLYIYTSKEPAAEFKPYYK